MSTLMDLQAAWRRLRAWSAAPGVKRAFNLLYWVLLAVLAFVAYRRFAPAMELEDLGAAPALEMRSLDGRTVRLSDLRGRVVVVNVWATWCAPCRVETPGFVELQREFGDEVVFLGLSTDESEEDVRRFAETMGVNYPLLVAPNLAGTGYQVPALPTTFLVGRDGRLRYRHEGLLLAHALRPALRKLAR